MEIILLLQSVSHLHTKTTFRQLTKIIEAMLAMTGRVTMLGVSRWSEAGGSYRTIQRFFGTKILWTQLNFHLFLAHRYTTGEEVAIAGDHTVVTKSGKETHGLDYFFSSLSNKAVKGLEFFSFSFVNVSRRESSPMLMEQTIRPKKQKTSTKKRKTKTKRKRGRPKGSKNKNHREIVLPPHLQLIQTHLKSVLAMVGSRISIKYLLLDGAFGNNNALQMTVRCGLHLISKLRHDAALYLPYVYEKEKTGPGGRKKYGEKVKYNQIDPAYLVKTIFEKGIETRIYRSVSYTHLTLPTIYSV